MTVVRDNLIGIYGPGTDYGFTNYEIHQGTVQSYIDLNHSDSIEFGKSIEANAKNPKPTEEINHRWAGTGKGRKLFADESVEKIVELFGDEVGTYADRDTTLEYLDKHVWITIRCRDGYNDRGLEYRPSVVFTASSVIYSQQHEATQ